MFLIKLELYIYIYSKRKRKNWASVSPCVRVVTTRNPFLSDSNRKSWFQIVQNPRRSTHPSPIDDIGQLLSHVFFMPQADGAISTPPPRGPSTRVFFSEFNIYTEWLMTIIKKRGRIVRNIFVIDRYDDALSAPLRTFPTGCWEEMLSRAYATSQAPTVDDRMPEHIQQSFSDVQKSRSRNEKRAKCFKTFEAFFIFSFKKISCCFQKKQKKKKQSLT